MADIDDLKLAFDQATAAFNKRDLDAILSFHHDQVVSFEIDAPFAIDGKSARREALQAYFADLESLTFTHINPQCRVVGSTGVVWTHMATAAKPKDGPMRNLFSRLTLIFAKSEGKWLLVSVHGSLIPSGN
jgi:ketosteroid isomerase-like protein